MNQEICQSAERLEYLLQLQAESIERMLALLDK